MLRDGIDEDFLMFFKKAALIRKMQISANPALLKKGLINSMDELFKEFPNGRFFYLTTKTKRKYTDIEFKDGDFIVFGPESRGLPAEYVTANTALTIPMKEGQRSLNLSNSVAIVAYEMIRQLGL